MTISDHLPRDSPERLRYLLESWQNPLGGTIKVRPTLPLFQGRFTGITEYGRHFVLIEGPEWIGYPRPEIVLAALLEGHTIETPDHTWTAEGGDSITLVCDGSALGTYDDDEATEQLRGTLPLSFVNLSDGPFSQLNPQ